MEETETNITEAVNIEDEATNVEDEGDIDMKEVIEIDEILSSTGGQVKMLDFERQMFLDCVYNDGLVICGK